MMNAPVTSRDIAGFRLTAQWLWGSLLAAVSVATILVSASRVTTRVADLPAVVAQHEQRLASVEARTDSVLSRLNKIECLVRVTAAVPGATIQECAFR